MRLFRRVRGASLLTRFAVVSLVLTVALGVVLSAVLSNAIAERAREQAEWTVIVSVRLGVQPRLTAEDLANGFDHERLARIEAVVDAAAENLEGGNRRLDDLDPVELNIYNRDRTVVYSNEHEHIGELSASDELDEVLAGDVASGFSHEADEGEDSETGDREFLEVYVPLQYAGSDTPDGAVELYLPYAPVAAAVAADVRVLIITLAASLAVFYAVLFRFIASA